MVNIISVIRTLIVVIVGIVIIVVVRVVSDIKIVVVIVIAKFVVIIKITWGIERLFKISNGGMQCEDKKLDFIPKTIERLERVKWCSVDENMS